MYNIKRLYDLVYELANIVSPEPPLLAHTGSESRGTFRQKARSLAPLNGWACAVKIYHDGMLEDTNSLDGAHLMCPVQNPHKNLHYKVVAMSMLIRACNNLSVCAINHFSARE